MADFEIWEPETLDDIDLRTKHKTSTFAINTTNTRNKSYRQ